MARNYPSEQLCSLCAGTNGEPLILDQCTDCRKLVAKGQHLAAQPSAYRRLAYLWHAGRYARIVEERLTGLLAAPYRAKVERAA